MRLREAQQRAERTHLRAAALHERAATLFRRFGDEDREQAELVKAKHDRAGAEAERRRQASS